MACGWPIVQFAPGSKHTLRLEYFESTGNARLKLVWDAGVACGLGCPHRRCRSRLPRASDAAVIVAGIEEGEFRDRASLALPGHQEELIRAVAATGKPTVVVLVGGSAITMSGWLDAVPAVMDAWYPGEQGGRAVADVLFGDYNPAGRLPITFPIAEGQLPLTYNHAPTGRGDDYLDLTGQPLFPVRLRTQLHHVRLLGTGNRAGHDRARRARQRCAAGFAIPVPVAGDEVVQLYLRDLLATTVRPVTQLEGFERLHLEPGEEREVVFRLGPHQLRMLDQQLRWVVEPGAFRIMIGSSSKDIRLRGELTVR